MLKGLHYISCDNLAKVVKSLATQLNVESDSVDEFALGHSQLQSVSCIHMDNLGEKIFNIQEILQSLNKEQSDMLLTTMREPTAPTKSLRAPEPSPMYHRLSVICRPFLYRYIYMLP